MIRSLMHWVLAAAVLVLPARLVAGGPPNLCLPLEGVNSANVQKCTELLNAKLASKFVNYEGWYRGAKIVERGGQWYLTFYMDSDVRLADVTTALEGSGCSVPESKLRLFGHVILEIDARSAAAQALVTDLKALKNVSVAETKTEKNLLLVTLDMPYPSDNNRRDLESVGWVSFQRNDFASDPATVSEPAVTADKLPGYRAIKDVIAKHGGSLSAIRWTPNYACRPLGGVAAK